MPQMSNRIQLFTDSVIRRMTRISDACHAINLSQGFPDFPPPKALTDALKQVADNGRTNIQSPMAPKICGRPLHKKPLPHYDIQYRLTMKCWLPVAARKR